MCKHLADQTCQIEWGQTLCSSWACARIRHSILWNARSTVIVVRVLAVAVTLFECAIADRLKVGFPDIPVSGDIQACGGNRYCCQLNGTVCNCSDSSGVF